MLEETLRRIGGLRELPEMKVFPSSPWEYRNRVQFHRAAPVGGGGGLGFKGRRSAEIVPLRDCPVVDPGIRRMLKEPGTHSTSGVPSADPRSVPSKGRFCALRVYSRGETFLLEEQVGQVNILDREITLSPGLFFQSNGAMLEQLIGDLKALALGADRNLPLGDLYCGVGIFGAFLGELFPGIDLMEESEAALALARENLGKYCPGRNVRFFPLEDSSWAKRFLAPAVGPCRGAGSEKCGSPLESPASYGLLILDPPRNGLSPALRRALAEKRPPLLAYISCNPAAFARDARELLAGGYRLRDLHLYDFYPQTPHIETLGIFEYR